MLAIIFVVFLYPSFIFLKSFSFTKHDLLKLPKLCNEEVGSTFPLELALESDQIEIATSLINHHADVNVIDSNGRTLLMRMLVKSEFFY